MTGHLNLKLAIVPAVLLALVCTAGALLHFRPVPPSRQAIAAPEVMKAGVFDPAYAAALIENRRGTRYTDEQADAAVASLQQPNDRRRVGEWIARFLQQG